MTAPLAPVLVRLPSMLRDPVRLHHGAAVEHDDWAALDRLARRRLLVRSRFATLTAPAVVSHRSAAALWGLPDWDADDGRLHVVDRAARKTHCGRGVIRNVGALAADDVATIDEIPVTSIAKTCVDVALTSSLRHAVVVLDAALRSHMITREQIAGRLEALRGRRGVARAAEALAFADPAAESPGESVSRLTAAELGAPRPVLQQVFETDRGRFRADFWWPAHGVVGEFDGRGKYASRDELWDEKVREDALRRLPSVRTVARWTMREARDPASLAAVLGTAGIPLPRSLSRDRTVSARRP